MKIFGKRKKTSAKSAEDDGLEETTAAFASDPVVKELLKKDPSDWNAKEKRMVKRYQKRVAESNGATEDDVPKDDKSSSIGEGEKNDTTTASQVEDENPKALELSAIVGASVFEALNSKQRRKLSRTLAQEGEKAIKDVVREANEIAKSDTANSATTGSTTGSSSANVEESTQDIPDDLPAGNDEMAQVEDLLKGLNSKQKRKLSRRLQREGESCLAEVKAEAQELLKGSTDAQGVENNDNGDGESTTEAAKLSGKKRKRRRGPTDLSGLTPEERLRREEQRKMQKEAAEKRENGEDTSSEFKHPLNSERRRANRRKPKWAPKKSFAAAEKIEHNSSGFQVRKFKKVEH